MRVRHTSLFTALDRLRSCDYNMDCKIVTFVCMLLGAANAGVLAPVARLDPFPQYSYGYDVQDALTGDYKGHHEHRNGDLVQGSYSVVDPDGTRRIVDYSADALNGFNAVVRREPLFVAAPRVVAPAVPVAPAPVFAPAPLVARAPIAAPAPAFAPGPPFPPAPLFAPAPLVARAPIAAPAPAFAPGPPFPTAPLFAPGPAPLARLQSPYYF